MKSGDSRSNPAQSLAAAEPGEPWRPRDVLPSVVPNGNESADQGSHIRVGDLNQASEANSFRLGGGRLGPKTNHWGPLEIITKRL